MKDTRSSTGRLIALAIALITLSATALQAQTSKMPSTLRYGSGLWDTPVASVLPHMAIVGTYSGFPSSVSRTVLTNADGGFVNRGGPFEKWLSDASVTLGLMDRAEVGVTFQNFADASSGGTMVGGHGRIAILKPEAQGLGLAVGARYVSAPSFDGVAGNRNYQPSRLGHPDSRLYESYTTRDDVNTKFSPYAVASAMLTGFDTERFPKHDLTFSLGWGRGHFSGGDQLPFYSFADSEGWFAGSVLHLEVGDNKLLNLIGEWNGFDINVGAQYDFGGFRLGGFLLGANYAEDVSLYRSKKFGVLGSVALCPVTGGLCKPEMIKRVQPDTIQLPAPPADTVVVEREIAPPLPTGTAMQICLATGQAEQVLVTAQGDTLVGPARVSVRNLRPGIVFAGTYAEGSSWYDNDESIRLERQSYDRSGGELRLNCGDIMRIGEQNGVALFADRGTSTPYSKLYVPVRPGVWQAYETGLRRTRGD